MSTDPGQVDIRGPRFAAWITTAVLVLTLIVSVFNEPGAAVILALRPPSSPSAPYGARATALTGCCSRSWWHPAGAGQRT